MTTDENSSLFEKSGDDMSRNSSIDSKSVKKPTINRIHKLNHQLYKLNSRPKTIVNKENTNGNANVNPDNTDDSNLQIVIPPKPDPTETDMPSASKRPPYILQKAQTVDYPTANNLYINLPITTLQNKYSVLKASQPIVSSTGSNKPTTTLMNKSIAKTVVFNTNLKATPIRSSKISSTSDTMTMTSSSSSDTSSTSSSSSPSISSSTSSMFQIQRPLNRKVYEKAVKTSQAIQPPVLELEENELKVNINQNI